MKRSSTRAARLIDPETIANVGLFYVCFRLSRYGWNVSPATRNARGFDVIATGPDGRLGTCVFRGARQLDN